MKTCPKVIFAGLVILTGSSFANSTNESPVANRDIELQKYRIKNALCENIISWLSNANESAEIECGKLADSLLCLEEPGVSSYFIAAQIAWLREKPEKAIAILEDVVSKEPNKKAPIGIVPVKIVARFWIATLARQSGDITKAKNVYETLLTMLESPQKIEGLEDKGGVMMICNLYLAEIESLHFKRKDLALLRLEAIEQVKKPDGQLGAGYNIYKSWAAYLHTKLSKGVFQANQQLVWYPEMMSGPLLAVTHLDLSGITGDPLIGCGGSDRRINIVIDTIANRIVKNTTSPIDRSLVRLGYGFYYQEQGRFDRIKKNNPEIQKYYAESEKHYSALFEEDSFFSPVAGLYLARLKKAQGKTVEAESMLESVKKKYPGFNSAVTELKESWEKQAR